MILSIGNINSLNNRCESRYPWLFLRLVSTWTQPMNKWHNFYNVFTALSLQFELSRGINYESCWPRFESRPCTTFICLRRSRGFKRLVIIYVRVHHDLVHHLACKCTNRNRGWQLSREPPSVCTHLGHAVK